MSYYANPSERTQLIAGLRALAAFLEENTDVPAPRRADVMVFPGNNSYSAKRREVDRIATLICVATSECVPGHYRASRTFGPVEYRAVAISNDARED